jgi:hypothetical protein
METDTAEALLKENGAADIDLHPSRRSRTRAVGSIDRNG